MKPALLVKPCVLMRIVRPSSSYRVVSAFKLYPLHCLADAAHLALRKARPGDIVTLTHRSLGFSAQLYGASDAL